MYSAFHFIIYTHIVAFEVTIDKSGCTIKHDFGGCGARNYELERVDVLSWLFYFCTIEQKFLAAVEQGIAIWKEFMSFGCFISAPSSTSLIVVEQGLTS